MTSEISIISNAISLLGMHAINSFDESNPVHVTARRLYAQVKPELLVNHPWRFAMESKTLDQLSSSPSVEDWSYAYTFPAAPSRILFFRSRPICDYEIFENKIFTNEPSLAMDYIYEISEEYFPVYFTSALIYYLASRLALPLTQNADLMKYWDNEAQRMIRTAMALEAQQQPNYMIQRDSLMDAHMVGSNISMVTS